MYSATVIHFLYGSLIRMVSRHRNIHLNSSSAFQVFVSNLLTYVRLGPMCPLSPQVEHFLLMQTISRHLSTSMQHNAFLCSQSHQTSQSSVAVMCPVAGSFTVYRSFSPATFRQWNRLPTSLAATTCPEAFWAGLCAITYALISS